MTKYILTCVIDADDNEKFPWMDKGGNIKSLASIGALYPQCWHLFHRSFVWLNEGRNMKANHCLGIKNFVGIQSPGWETGPRILAEGEVGMGWGYFHSTYLTAKGILAPL